MEVREFAERVLFADSLDEKLAFPGPDAFSDDQPGDAVQTPGLPGRPADLRLRSDGVRVPFPRRHQLIDEEQRAILMHFFANHELLATELMALVLLKFPDAPTAFRRGIIHTLHEEQEHTRWYMERMTQCGVRFGDFPVNRFFWDSIAPMESPLDYVTRLSLTFEQANLDYSRHFAEIMRVEGDEKTAVILSRIYRDEIAHVGYGLKWFRRWKNDQETDWQAFRRQLRFPLSPRRARADVTFNEEGRLKAGLDPDFIRQLKIFAQSKGRTPDIYFFNPDAEREMAGSMDDTKHQAPRAVTALAEDLDILPVFLARADDVVLVRREPTIEQCERWADFGFEIPEFEVITPGPALDQASPLRDRKARRLRPWSWSPVTAGLYAPLGGNVVPPLTTGQIWNDHIRNTFSKCWSTALLVDWCALAREPSRFDPATAGRACPSVAEAEERITQLRHDGFPSIALKAPFGTAGSMNRRLMEDEPLTPPMAAWIERIITRQEAIVVEPWLDRLQDFSVQYEMEPDGALRHIGFIELENDARGQFTACRARPKFCRGMDPAVVRLLMNGGLSIYREQLKDLLEERLRQAGYVGPVGIDAFVYRDRSGEPRLKPLVEINPRFTMGRLTRELMRRVNPGREVEFRLASKAMAATASSDDLAGYAHRLEKENPPAVDDDGKLRRGTFVLNDATAARQVLAVLSVS